MRTWKCYQPLAEMERITRQELADHFDDILERIDRENIGVVILDDKGEDGHVLCPADWMNDYFDECCVEIEVEENLLRQLREVITPMGLTPEILVQRFFEWVADPETREEAVAWILDKKGTADRTRC